MKEIAKDRIDELYIQLDELNRMNYELPDFDLIDKYRDRIKQYIDDQILFTKEEIENIVEKYDFIEGIDYVAKYKY